MYEFKVIAIHLHVLARHWSFKLGNCKAEVSEWSPFITQMAHNFTGENENRFLLFDFDY